MSASGWTLRPVTARDQAFVVELNRVAIGPYLETTFGWDDAAQRAYFDERFDAHGGQVIQFGGVDVGELLLEETPAELRVVRLALLPDWQGRGIGSAVVRALIGRANELQMPLVLDVFRTNVRAARLYESLGFIRVSQNDIDVSMRLEPTV